MKVTKDVGCFSRHKIKYNTEQFPRKNILWKKKEADITKDPIKYLGFYLMGYNKDIFLKQL